jgi:hypothetical protein
MFIFSFASHDYASMTGASARRLESKIHTCRDHQKYKNRDENESPVGGYPSVQSQPSDFVHTFSFE